MLDLYVGLIRFLYVLRWTLSGLTPRVLAVLPEMGVTGWAVGSPCRKSLWVMHLVVSVVQGGVPPVVGWGPTHVQPPGSQAGSGVMMLRPLAYVDSTSRK